MGLERFRDISGRGGGGSPPRRRFPGGNNSGGGDMDSVGRVPPHSIEAEMAVLGAMLLGDRGAVERAMELVTRDDFYREAHGHIFDAMVALNGKGEPIDIITLQNEMNQLGTLEPIGIEYLLQLSDIEFTTSNVGYYAQIVSEKATLRRLIEAASRIASQAYGEVDEVTDLVDQAERLIFEVARKRSGQGFTPLRPLLTDVFERLDTVYQDKGVVTGVDTGFNDMNAMTSGLQPGDLFILAARPSMGKCLTATSLVVDPQTGQRIPLRDYVEQQIPFVARLSDCGSLGVAPISHWVNSGIQPCWRVTTRLGRSVEVTGHHPFRTVLGWTPLHDIRVGDKIAIPRCLPIFGNVDVCSEEARLLAYFIAEGGSTHTSPTFTSIDPVILADFFEIISSQYPACHLRQERITCSVVLPRCGGKLNPCTVWLRDLGVWGKKAEEKSFPGVVWTWKRPHLAEFLRVLFSCDGTIYSLQGFPGIEFAVASKQLAHDVQHALTRFGIIATLGRKADRCWRVEITDPASVATYNREIGWIGEKTERMFDANRYNPQTNQGTEILDSNILRTIASPDIYWDEVISIDPIGEHPVYDLTVPDGANFVAEDIFVHNTSLAMGIGQNACLREKSVAVFSLEMSKEQLVQRLICSEARVDAHRMRTGFLHDSDWDSISAAVQRLWDANLFIDDTTEMSALEMRARCRRLQAEYGLDLVIVDYLQLMRGSGRMDANRNEEITTIARGLKGLARELRVPVIALSQLSRAVERREDKRPMLSDLRESGAIEAEADLVAFIYRPAYYERKQEYSKEAQDKADEQEGGNDAYQGEEAEVIIAKHRNGPTGTVKLAFLPKYARFDNLAEFRESPF